MTSYFPDTSDLSGHEPEKELDLPSANDMLRDFGLPHVKVDLREQLRKNHHGQDCIICFEKECVCKPRG